MKSHKKFLFNLLEIWWLDIQNTLKIECKSFILYFRQREWMLWRNGNKYLTLVPTNDSKEKIKKYEDLPIKIRDLIRSITESFDDYDKKYMNIKFNSDDK